MSKLIIDLMSLYSVLGLVVFLLLFVGKPFIDVEKFTISVLILWPIFFIVELIREASMFLERIFRW